MIAFQDNFQPAFRPAFRSPGTARTGGAKIRTIAFVGDSITAAMNAPAVTWSDGGYGAMAFAYSGGRFEPVINSGTGLYHFATSGWRTLTMQSNANGLPGALATTADGVLVHGGTNDYTDGRTTDQVRDTLLEMWLAIRAAGKRPIATTVLPTSTTGARATWIAELNSKIRIAALANGVMICDWTNLLDAGTDTGVVASGMLYDGLHPGRQGAAIMGKALAECLNPYLSDATAEAWYSVAEAGVMASTNGRFTSGSPVATGYSFFPGTGASNTSSIVARADGKGNWQQLAYSDPSPSTVAQFTATVPAAASQGIVAGEKFQLACELEISDTAGLRGLCLELRPASVPSERSEFLSPASVNAGTMPAPSRRMMLRSSVIVATGSTDRVYGRLWFAGSGTYRIGRFIIRRF